MGTRLYSVVIDSEDHDALGRWWAETLGWKVVHADAREVAIVPSGGPEVLEALVFVPVPEPKSGKNRVHLDVASTTFADQSDIVQRVIARGAQRADIGQRDVSWVVLRDPEGNEFCVLPPEDRFVDIGTLAAVVVDAHDPVTLARFWAEASGWHVSVSSHLVATLRHPTGRPPALDIVAVEAPTPGKNRLHLDVAPALDDDLEREVERLLRLGAEPADVGQRDVTWAVLRDPEGNEFCVLSPR
jgi:predicted enzyme related to lactoylglutathione lyase